jgi:hypothetical protein
MKLEKAMKRQLWVETREILRNDGIRTD